MNAPAFAKSSLLRIALVLAVVFGVVFATVKQADLLLGQALSGAFGTPRATYRSVWFDWSGNVTARHVVLQPEAGESLLSFDRVWLETPGWGFFLRHAFDRSLASADWPRLHLVLGDLQDASALPQLVPGFGPVGSASGALLETAGCRTARRFDREALSAMGLVPGEATLEIDERIEGAALTRSVALEARGSSRTQLERVGMLDAPRASLLGQRPALRVSSERWRVRDQGFVPARNRWCAAADGVPLREFPERHIAAVDAFVQRAGLAVDENARAFYRRFARSGGEMAFGGEYQPPLSLQEAAGARDGGRAFARMNATLERDTRAVPIVWRQVPVVPGPQDGATESAVAQAPGPQGAKPAKPSATNSATPSPGRPPVPAATGPASPAIAKPAPVTVAHPDAPPVSNPVTPTVANRPAPAVAKPASPPSANPASAPATNPTSPPVAKPASPPVANPAAPPAANPASAPVAKPAPPVAKPSTPPAAAPRGGPRIERAPPATRRDTLAWEDLANHRGRRVRLWTVHNPPRTVELIDVQGDTARVRAKLGGGNAEYSVQRSGFLKAVPIR